eukprot:1892885-Rhodomonas_salina.1
MRFVLRRGKERECVCARARHTQGRVRDQEWEFAAVKMGVCGTRPPERGVSVAENKDQNGRPQRCERGFASGKKLRNCTRNGG